MEPTRGAEVEEGVLVGVDVAVDAVDTAVYAYAAVDLVVGKADLRGRGEGGGLASGAARDDATRPRDGRRAGAETRRGARDASGESERARTIAGLEMHCMTSVVASRARSADATRGRECPHAAGGGERVPAGVLTHTRGSDWDRSLGKNAPDGEKITTPRGFHDTERPAARGQSGRARGVSTRTSRLEASLDRLTVETDTRSTSRARDTPRRGDVSRGWDAPRELWRYGRR